MLKIFDRVKVGKYEGVIVAIERKRKWAYYDVIIPEVAEIVTTDWGNEGYTYETIREDQLL